MNHLNQQLEDAVSDLRLTNEKLLIENTERKRVKKALAEVNKKLQLMAGITRHDILNQLNAMQGYLEIYKMDLEDDATAAEDVFKKALAMIERTKNTIEFTKNYQEIGCKSPRWQEINELVEVSIKQTNTDDIAVENDIPRGIEVYADPLIVNVFHNLIDNAVRYGEKLTYIKFRTISDNGTFRILCEDNGVGIPKEEKENIFSYEYGMNTGFGLFLARETLEITGIRIIETGRHGEGARFELICPEETVRTGQHGSL